MRVSAVERAFEHAEGLRAACGLPEAGRQCGPLAIVTRPPASEAELYDRASRLAGQTLAAIAQDLGRRPPADLKRSKGWVGELLELALGATAGPRPVPDFEALGVELKTIPVRRDGVPKESTYVCSVPLTGTAGSRWESSIVRIKLARVLWIPVEAAAKVALADRRIGTPILWSPSLEDEQILRADWEEHMDMIALGRLEEVDARLGTYLQIRPKAFDGSALTAIADADGEPGLSLPRGFYLRTGFTRRILELAAGAHAAPGKR
jgi:DNA mismatch repair protein MutH